jgi:hypothetical protein
MAVHAAQHAARTAPEADSRGAYEPGRCNIGPTEIAARRRFGHAGLAVAVGAVAVLMVTEADPAWRLILFFPVAGAATGYLQAALRFCAGFGMEGVYNFSDRLRATRTVADEAARRADRSRALQIFGLAALIGAAVALAAVLVG